MKYLKFTQNNRRGFGTTGLFVLVALFFVSCSQDELTEQGTPLPVGQYPLELTAGGLQAEAALSPASTRSTAEGDWSGVQSVMVQDGKNAPKAYLVTANGSTSSATLSCNDPFWWTNTNEIKTVSAWHPVRHPDDPTINFETREPQPNDKWSVPADQSGNNFDASAYDFIYAHKEIAFANHKETQLEFRHLLSKVVVNLNQSPYLSANSQDVSVSLINCALKGQICDSNNGFILASFANQDQTLTMRKVAPNAQAFASYDALVVPQSVQTSSLTILVKVGAVSYACPLNTLTANFLSGMYYTFNITVNAHDLDVKVSDIGIGWGSNTSGNGSGSVTLP